MNALSFDGITKLFRLKSASPVTAVAELTLSVPVGEVTGLVGPCGAGKSTLLRIAAGRIRPTSGRVVSIGPVAMIPRRLPWHLTVTQLLERSSLPAERVPQLLAELDLTAVAERSAAHLGRETQWWVQVAVALAGAPTLLLADDPLPEILTVRLRQWVERTGRTILLATEQVGAASLACHRLHHLQAGHLVETIAGEEPRRRPFPRSYALRVRGHLSARWVRWFDGLAVTNLPDGDALIAGEMVDQGALHGVIAKVRDCGLPLLSITPLQFKS